MTNRLLDPNAKLVVAHRGNRVGAPENTVESFRQAVAIGADALEFDVRMTRDGVPVVFHDPALDRTTNGHGLLAGFTFDELASLDAGAAFKGSGSERHTIPLLEEVMEGFRDLPLVIEVKEMAAVDSTERLVRKLGLQESVVIGSSDQGVMSRFYRSGLACCASMRDAVKLIPLAMLGLTPRKPMYNVLSVTPRFHGVPIPVERMAAVARRLGLPTQVWTVNEPAEAASLWAAGVAAIVTDDPAAILRVRPH